MPTYILLSKLTPQGVQTLRANPDRLREVNRDVEELGARVLHQWATLGPYDFVNVVEAEDAAAIARVSVALGARGSSSFETLTALTIDEFLGAISVNAAADDHRGRDGFRPRRRLRSRRRGGPVRTRQPPLSRQAIDGGDSAR